MCEFRTSKKYHQAQWVILQISVLMHKKTRAFIWGQRIQTTEYAQYIYLPVVIHPHSSMGCCAQFPPDFCLELVASRKYVDTSVVPTLDDDTQHTKIWWGIKMGRIFLCHSWWLKFLFWLPPLYATLLLREPTSACTYNSPHLVIVVEDGLQSKLLI